MTAVLDRVYHLDTQRARHDATRDQLYADLHDVEVEEQEARTVLLRMAALKLDLSDRIRTIERQIREIDQDRNKLLTGELAAPVRR